ncbi:MAG: response regulator [Planctomycetota bacterium]|jgi:DNA-binding NtrC family response regulator
MTTPLKILIADRDLRFRDPLVRILRDSGVMLLVVENARDVTRSIESEHVDAVLIDMLFPGMEDMGILKSLRNGDETGKDIPVILSSQRRVDKNDVNQAMASRANALILKPFSAQDICERLLRILPEDRRSAIPASVTEDGQIKGTIAVGDVNTHARSDISAEDTGEVSEETDEVKIGKPDSTHEIGPGKSARRKKKTRTKILNDQETSSEEDTQEKKKETGKKKKKTAPVRNVLKTGIVAAPGKSMPHLLDRETLGKLKVLLADSEDSFRSGARKFLDNAGISCEESRTSKEAIDKLSEGDFNVLVSENVFEDESAVPFLGEVCSSFPEIAICIIARDPELVTVSDVVRLGVGEYLVKPLSSTQLVLAVERAYYRKRVETDAAAETEKKKTESFESEIDAAEAGGFEAEEMSAQLVETRTKLAEYEAKIAALEGQLDDSKDNSQHASGEISAAIGEIAKYEHDIAKLKDEHSRLKIAYKDLKSTKENQESEFKATTAEMEMLRQQFESNSQETSDLKEKTEAADSEIENLRQSLQAAEQVRSEADAFHSERDTIAAQRDEIKKQFDEATTRIQDLESMIETEMADSEKSAAEKDALELKLREMEEKQVEIREQLDENEAEMLLAQEERAKIEKTVEEREANLLAAADEKHVILEKMGKLEGEIAGYSKEREGGKADSVRLRRRVREMDAEISRLRKELDEAHAEMVKNVAQTASETLDKQRTGEGQIERYRAALEQARTEIGRLGPEISEAIDSNEKLAAQLAVVTRERDGLRRGLASARAGGQAEHQIREFEKALTALETENRALAERVKLLQVEKARLAASAGTGLAGGGAVGESILRAEIDELRGLLAAAKPQRAALEIENQRLTRQMQKMEEENRSLASQVASSRHVDLRPQDGDTAGVREIIQKLRDNLAFAKKDYERIEAENAGLAARIKQLEAEKAAIGAPLSTAPGADADVENRILKAEVEELRRILESTKTGHSGSEIEKQRLLDRVAQLETENTQLATSLAGARHGEGGADAKILQAEVLELRKMLSETRSGQTGFDSEKLMLREKVSSLETQVTELTSKLVAFKHEDIRPEGRVAVAEMEELGRLLTDAKSARTGLEMEKQNLLEQVSQLELKNAELRAALTTTRHSTQDSVESRILQAEVEELRRKLAASKPEHAVLDIERRSLNERIQRLEEENADIAKKLAAAKHTDVGARDRIAGIELEEVKRRLEMSEKKHRKLEDGKREMLERARKLEEENARLSASIAASSQGGPDVETRVLRAELEEFRSQLDTARSERMRAEAEKRSLETRIQQLETDADELTAALARARSSIATTEMPVSGDSDEEKEWLRNRIKELEAEAATLHVEIREAQAIIGEIEGMLES